MDVLLPGDAFDRELKLPELLGAVSTERLRRCLTALLGGGFRLTDAQGKVVLEDGSVSDDSAGMDVMLEIEPVGRLQASGPREKLQAGAEMLELLLRSQQRYHMAARLHEEQVSHDYQRLQQEHAALLKSELKYRKLSEELEARVQQQVETLKAAERQLSQAEKLASVGQLAAGVAHEINNPIGFIRSNLSTAADYVRQMAKVGEAVRSGDAGKIAATWKDADMDYVLEDFGALLQESISGADRVKRIIADLKEFSNVDRSAEDVIFLNESVRAVCNIAHTQLGGDIELILGLGELPPFQCQPGHMNQMLLNLLLNAIQAIGDDKGVIRIETTMAGPDIRIRVADTGCGIPPENLAKIFDPFFTTRDVGKGTGLGLTVCRDIVQAHGGRIEVESKLGEGSTFTIYLPVQ
jgi:signal transduction histidine kinase